MKDDNLFKRYKDIIILGFIAILIGVIVGAFDTLFGKVLLYVTSIREVYAMWLIPFLSIVGLVIVFMYDRYGKNSIKGMSLVFEAGHGEADEIPIRLIPLVTVSTWLTHLFGGSAGREGVAIQIGATVAHGVGQGVNIDNENSTKILLVAGMAAGFSGLFQTPIAAVFFAIEVLTVGVLEHNALFPTLIASFAASFISHILGLEKFSVNLVDEITFDWMIAIKIVILGIAFGIIGGLFADALQLVKNIFKKLFKSPGSKIFIVGVIISVFSLILHMGRYSGLGTNLISECFYGEIYSYDFIMKTLFTVVTIAAGFQGGEVTPLFSIGASAGVLMASLIGLPVPLVAALGYASVFGSATNTLIAPMFIGAEVFGFEYMPYFFVTCMLAYIFNGNKSIYPLQKK
ncbi:MAG: chloride channel protein [Sedimentibacter sp.]|uniref:chloride channel protein n=1 Tax=Sedimentibacter sp. TaxID=1960295 RepID=UPI0029811238|nr:chloride channel protein [Sedimentibacter sp.]MDW5299627.1 chloride channel protein [Sedimentibacter sp.]